MLKPFAFKVSASELHFEISIVQEVEVTRNNKIWSQLQESVDDELKRTQADRSIFSTLRRPTIQIVTVPKNSIPTKIALNNRRLMKTEQKKNHHESRSVPTQIDYALVYMIVGELMG